MNQQIAKYLNGLLSQKSAKSVAISLGETSIKLNKIAESMQKTVNSSVVINNQQKKHIKSRYLSQNKFVRHKIETQSTQKSKSQLFDLVEKVKRVRTQAQNDLNNSSSNLIKLNLQKKILNTIRRQKEILDYINKLDQQKKRKKIEQQRQQKQATKKQKLILHRLQLLENQRQRRRAAITQKLMGNQPRYKLIEKQYLLKQIQKQLQDKAILNNQKIFKQKYRVPPVNRQQNQAKQQKDSKKKTRFSQDNQQNYKLNKLVQFKKQLQQKSRNIMLSMHKQKNNQVEIIKDKISNPLKYNFLKAKNLTDEQIFNQFKDFQLNFNAQSLGNLYLKKLKDKNLRQSRLQTYENLKSDQVSQSELSRDQYLQNTAKLRSSSNYCQNISYKSKQLKNLAPRQETQRKIIKSSSNNKLNNEYFQKQKASFMQKRVDENYLQFLKSKIQSFQKYKFQ